MPASVLDDREFRRRVAAIKKALPRGSEAALQAAMGPVLGAIVHSVPRDTNRLARGYALAARGAGVEVSGGVPRVVASKYTEAAERKLREQVEKFERMRDDLLAEIAEKAKWKGRGAVQRKSAEKLLRRVEKWLARAREEEGKLTDTSIVFGLFGEGQTARGRKVGTTVRERIYGGDGRVVSGGGRSVMFIHNKEPHATLIEKVHGNVKAAFGAGRSVGLKKGRDAFAARVLGGNNRGRGVGGGGG